jgi:hypothetical protein
MFDNPYPFPPQPDTLQLEVDAANVEEGRVDINSFPPDYQQKIRDFYRFSATRHMSNDGTIAKMTPGTLDLI